MASDKENLDAFGYGLDRLISKAAEAGVTVAAVVGAMTIKSQQLISDAFADAMEDVEGEAG